MVGRGQLGALGLARWQIDHRVATGRLHQLHRGVYSVGHRVVGREGRWLAAVLAVGKDALLSHRSAAAVWNLRADGRSLIDITTSTRAHKSRSGLAVHRPRSFDPYDATVHRGIPCTTVARTIADLAAVLDRPALTKTVRRADQLQFLDTAALGRQLGSRRRGAAALRAVLAGYQEGVLLRSDLEARFLDLCLGAGLPSPRVNSLVAGHEVDFFWPAHRLVVETDGFETHRTRDAFEADRRRDAALLSAGIRVVRFSYRQVVGEPHGVVKILRRLLSVKNRVT